MKMIRRYNELIRLPTFAERFEYLKLGSSVGVITFGYDRYLNQALYGSREWRACREEVILRDLGCDLGISGREISGGIRVHHMNPLTPEDLEDNPELVFDPQYLICTSLNTHNAIHYGGKAPEEPVVIIRKQWDTAPWRL